jgi:O-antigen ligase
MFNQPNLAGNAIALAAAFAFVLNDQRQLSRFALTLILVACGVGILTCASRGGMLALLVVLLLGAVLAARRRSGRWPIVSLSLATGTLWLAIPLLGQAASHLTERLTLAGFDNVDRLGEVVRAISGSPDDLMEDDSSRLKLVDRSLEMIAQHPILGQGTGNFAPLGEIKAHNMFLAVLGENGLVGGFLYGAFLVAMALGVRRAPAPLRSSGVVVLVAWLLPHMDSHTLLEVRVMSFPIAYLCGICGRDEGRVDPAAS